MASENAQNVGIEMAELLQTHGLRPTEEFEQVLNLAWAAELYRSAEPPTSKQPDIDSLELSRASCVYSALALDADSERLLRDHGLDSERYLGNISLIDFKPSPTTIPPRLHANPGLVDAIERYVSRFPERTDLDPIGLVYGCLATERGRFITALKKSGLAKNAVVRVIEERFDSEMMAEDKIASETDDPTLEAVQQTTPTSGQETAQMESANESTEDEFNFRGLLDYLQNVADQKNRAQLLDGAKQACAYALAVDMAIDNVLLFAALLMAPRRGEQQEESWFALFNALTKQKGMESAPPEDVLGLRLHHPGLEEISARASYEQGNSADVKVRAEVFQSIGDAVYTAEHVSLEENRNIGVRHLLTALVWGSMPRVRLHLQNTNIQLDELAHQFNAWTKQSASKYREDPILWADTLGIDSSTETSNVDDSSGVEKVEKPESNTAVEEEVEPRPASLPIVDDTVGSSVPFIERFAGFAADSAEDPDDLLGVELDVNAICSILAARHVPLPLSLGLFGDWGSGKTFFMNMMYDRIELLADSSKGKDESTTAYCDNVVQIRFNAWHYIDANLWASLVTYILDELHASLTKESPDPWDAAVKNLEEVQGLHEEAKHAHEQAELSVIEAKAALEAARNSRVQRIKEIEEEYNALTKVLVDEAKAQWNKITDDLGLDESVSTVGELSKEIKNLKSRGESLSGSLATMARSKYAIPYFAVILLILLLPIGIGYLIPKLIEQTGFGIDVGTFIGQIGTVVVGIGAWLHQPLKWISKGISSLEGIQEKVEAKRQKLLSDDNVKPEAELAILRETETAARENMRVAEKRLHEAGVALKESQPSRRLYRLIEERAESEDYRSRLGIISLIRNDFEKLSDLIRSRKSKPSDSEVEKAADKSSAVPKQDPIPIDRIILYIDDLDRCPADRVVQVLEAVHLLLAFPIFVVVVAVDPRWLRRSLELTHPHLLTGLADESASIGNGRPSGARAATPQNYLEKIFQVPFNLRPMGRVGYQNLIQKLVQKPDDGAGATGLTQTVPEQSGNQRPGSQKTATGQTDATSSIKVNDGSDVPPGPDIEKVSNGEVERSTKKTKVEEKTASKTKKRAVIMRSEQDLKAQADSKEAESGDNKAHESIEDVSTPTSSNEDKLPELKPPALELSEDEKKFLEVLNLLFRTPRAVKRFVNTYRIFRVRAPGSDTDVFKGTEANLGEYRCAMVLLAILTGFPALANKAIRIIFRQHKEASWNDIVEAFKGSEVQRYDFATDELAPTMHEGRTEWIRLCAALEDLGKDDALPFNAGTFRSWTPWVARYSFSNVLPAYREAE